MTFSIGFCLYVVIVNIIGCMAMGIDKRKAQKHKWRIRESALFFWALIGGSLGSWIGMYLFRHKTKHWYFVVGIPAILALQIFLIILGMHWFFTFS